MEQISHIHCLQPVFLPLHELQAEFQKMGIGTGSELLQPGNASLQSPSVKRSGCSPSDPAVLIGKKGRIHQLFYLFPVRLLTVKIAVQL